MSAAYQADIHPVDQASLWADEMVMRELRQPGDLDNALKRVGRRTGVGYRLLWSLRYRRPKDISASAFLKLWQAWEAFKENQMRALEHDIARTRLEAGNDHHSIAAAEAVLEPRGGPDEAPVADAADRSV
ncbi:hypothetical protein ACUSIJ_24820 [Pseudochelatococcus sp. B33]